MAIHDLSGKCPKCLEIRDRYPGWNEELWNWFASIQLENPEAHISCLGRNQADQELLYSEHRSNAHWMQSAHNYNLACDIFRIYQGTANYAETWFNSVIVPALSSNITWYGRPGAPYRELPHCEITNWKELVSTGAAKLVE